MINYLILEPHAAARRDQYMRQAEDWRLHRSLNSPSSIWHTARQRIGRLFIRSGGYLGSVTLDDCLAQQQRTA